MVSGEGPQTDEQVRAAELAASLCLATDLGMGFPFEHGLHSTLIAMRLGDRLGIDRSTASQTFYACLLMYSGCTTDAEISTGTFGGSLTTHFVPVMFGSEREMLAGVLRALPEPGGAAPARAIQIVRRLPKAGRERDPHLAAICEVAQMLAGRLGLPAPVQDLFAHLTERWDGKGRLRRAEGEGVPLPVADRACSSRRRPSARAGRRRACRPHRPRAKRTRIRSGGRRLPRRWCR